jgi:hypothetical protein
VMQPNSRKTGAPGRPIGYARVSTDDQDTDPQRDEPARHPPRRDLGWSSGSTASPARQLEAAGAHFRSLRDPIDTCR